MIQKHLARPVRQSAKFRLESGKGLFIYFVSRVGVVVVAACWLVLGWYGCYSSYRTPVLLVVLASIHAESRFRLLSLLLLIMLRCYQFIWPLWCWDNVTSELPVDLTSVANLSWYVGLLGQIQKYQIQDISTSHPFHFLLIGLDPENVKLATLVNFPTVSVWLDLRNITLATLVMFLSARE